MKAKNKPAIFICQITDSALKVVKCLKGAQKREFAGLEFEKIAPDSDDKKIAQSLQQALRKLGYRHEVMILALGRNYATLRSLKIPAQSSQEIEQIIALQASRYLPYPNEELITAYQLISVDKTGYSQVNLMIVQRSVIERYLKIFKLINVKVSSIILSSCGLFALYRFLQPAEPQAVMLLDIEGPQAELSVVLGKPLYSRGFKINWQQPDWENALIEEIGKTRQAYSKEFASEMPQKIIMFNAAQLKADFSDNLSKQLGCAIEVLDYQKKVGMPQGAACRLVNADISFAGIIGLGLTDPEESLSLLPPERKEQLRKFRSYQQRLRRGLLVCAWLVLLGLAAALNIHNKSAYLQHLKKELNRLTQQAKPLEAIDRRLNLLNQRLQQKPAVLDLVYDLHRFSPAEISLSSFTYEEDKGVVLRGQAPQLSTVFSLVAQLEKAESFKGFNLKVRYATHKKTLAAEFIDFEISAAKK